MTIFLESIAEEDNQHADEAPERIVIYSFDGELLQILTKYP